MQLWNHLALFLKTFPLILVSPSGTTSRPPEPGIPKLGSSSVAITRVSEMINMLERVLNVE